MSAGNRGGRELHISSITRGKHDRRQQGLGSGGTDSLNSARMAVKPFFPTKSLQSLI